MPKAHHSKSSTTKALEKATKDWRSAKKRERAARNALAAIVNEAVASGVMSENKVASVTAIPRMTIRKMLGKDDAAAEDTVTDEPIVAAVEVPVIASAAEGEAAEPDVASADQATEPVVSVDDAAQSDTDTEEAPEGAPAEASEETPADDVESPEPAVPSQETPAWGGVARPSFLA